MRLLFIPFPAVDPTTKHKTSKTTSIDKKEELK